MRITGKEIFSTISHWVRFSGVIWKMSWDKEGHVKLLDRAERNHTRPSPGATMTHWQRFHVEDQEVKWHGQANRTHEPDILPGRHPQQGLVFRQATKQKRHDFTRCKGSCQWHKRGLVSKVALATHANLTLRPGFPAVGRTVGFIATGPSRPAQSCWQWPKTVIWKLLSVAQLDGTSCFLRDTGTAETTGPFLRSCHSRSLWWQEPLLASWCNSLKLSFSD